MAEPKVGKSAFSLVEAVGAVVGQNLLTGRPSGPRCRVAYINLEDDQHSLNGRVAAILLRYGIDQDEVAGRLFVSSFAAEDWCLISGKDPVVHAEAVGGLAAFIAAENIDLVIFDPLQELSQSDEDGLTTRLLGRTLKTVAIQGASAIGLVHHLRKEATGSRTKEPTFDGIRGSGALRGLSRFTRLLRGMPDLEGKKIGVDARYDFQISDTESNHMPPSAAKGNWFKEGLGAFAGRAHGCHSRVPGPPRLGTKGFRRGHRTCMRVDAGGRRTHYRLIRLQVLGSGTNRVGTRYRDCR